MEEGRRLSRETIERALALNPSLGILANGRLEMLVDFDWAGAVESVRRALVLEPRNPEYLDQAAYSAARFGCSDEALALARRAVELDPLNAFSWGTLGKVRVYTGQLEETEADVKKSQMSPGCLARSCPVKRNLFDAGAAAGCFA
jgi:Flp pilus assembly protein TadD